MKASHITLVKLLLLLFLAILPAFVGVGCNTAHDFGQDMEKAGTKIQDGTK